MHGFYLQAFLSLSLSVCLSVFGKATLQTSFSLSLSLSLYIYIYMCVCVCVCVCILIWSCDSGVCPSNTGVFALNPTLVMYMHLFLLCFASCVCWGFGTDRSPAKGAGLMSAYMQKLQKQESFGGTELSCYCKKYVKSTPPVLHGVLTTILTTKTLKYCNKFLNFVNFDIRDFDLLWSLIIVPVFNISWEATTNRDETTSQACRLPLLSWYCARYSQLSHVVSVIKWRWFISYLITLVYK